MKSNPVRRRKFLKTAVAAAAASAASCGGRSSPWRFFTVEEAATVAALADRIIPPDQDPGAGGADAGFVRPQGESVSDAPFADRHLLESAMGHDLADDKDAGSDDIGAPLHDR